MKRALKLALRSVYILPAFGILLGGDLIKQKPVGSAASLFNPEHAHADVPGGGGGGDGGIPGDCPTGDSGGADSSGGDSCC